MVKRRIIRVVKYPCYRCLGGHEGGQGQVGVGEGTGASGEVRKMEGAKAYTKGNGRFEDGVRRARLK